MLILLCPMSRTQQYATIWKNLRLTELHGDGELPETCEALAERLPRNQLIIAAESDMRLDNSVLPWIKPLSDWLDNCPLSRWQK